MNLPRITIRKLMILVAITGLACGTEMMRRRRSLYLERAAWHAMRQRVIGKRGIFVRADLDFHAASKARFERAARYPWLPAPPDPRDPQ